VEEVVDQEGLLGGGGQLREELFGEAVQLLEGSGGIPEDLR
jgi:hypothetical protein